MCQLSIARPADRKTLADLYRDGLLNDVLPFWLRHGVDRDAGGIFTCLDRDGSIIDSDKAMWQQGRFTWLLGELYNHPRLSDHPQRATWLEIARRNLKFIDRFGFDPNDGRMWFHVTQSGAPIRKRRYSFTESFAAIAYAEMAKATGSERYAEKASACFDAFRAPANPEKFTATRPAKSLGLPMITIVTARQLREAIGLDSADEWIERSLAEIEQDFLNADSQCVMETVGRDGKIIDHFDGRLLNPGHAIECAWFVMHEGKLRNDRHWIEMGCKMLDWMWIRGWDEEFGGLRYFADLRGLPVQEYWHDMKFWWPHNEAIIATLLAYQVTGDAKYARWHAQVHGWAYDHFPDAQFGEWFGYLHRDGRLSTQLKGNLWKGPFHLPRMQLVCWDLCLNGEPT